MPEKMCGPITGLPIRSARPGRNVAGQFQAAFAAADFDILADLGSGRFVDHRPDVRAGVGRVADHQCPRRFDEPAQELDRGRRPRRSRGCMPNISARCSRRPTAARQHRLVEIGRFVDDDRVLAAHLADDFLDEGLAGLRVAGHFQDPQADLLRSRKGDQGHARIADQHVAHFAARAGQELQALRCGTPACQRISQSSRAMPRVCDDGLTTAVLPVTNAAVVMPAQMAKGKFQGLMIAATPRG